MANCIGLCLGACIEFVELPAIYAYCFFLCLTACDTSGDP
jgi:hypothetical protein